MKKQYHSPQTELIAVAQSNIICVSNKYDRDIRVKKQEDDSDFKWDDVN